MTAQKILIDTSVILEGGEDIIAKLDKVAPVFVTDIVLQELDGHKNNANGAVAYQAREFFRRLGKTNGEALFVLPPDGMKLEKTDTLRKMTLGNTPLHVIVRKPYKSRDINDSKIIEVAKDYNMTLVTLDMAQRVRGLSDGVEAVTLESILPNKSFKEDVIQMSEIKQDYKQNKKTKSDFPIGASIVFISIFALFFLVPLGKDGIELFAISSGFVLLLATISTFLKPKVLTSPINSSNDEIENSFLNENIDSSLDSMYSGTRNNVYTSHN